MKKQTQSPFSGLENVVLSALLSLGGKAQPADVYAAVETAFPNLPGKAAKNLKFRTRFARKSLVMSGHVSDKVRGEWALTALGRKRAVEIIKN